MGGGILIVDIWIQPQLDGMERGRRTIFKGHIVVVHNCRHVCFVEKGRRIDRICMCIRQTNTRILYFVVVEDMNLFLWYTYIYMYVCIIHISYCVVLVHLRLHLCKNR